MGIEEKAADWNDAYNRGGNLLFYPHEEIIRFVNKYVRKRDGINEFHDVMELTKEEWDNFKSLDLGCGIGRHVKFLDEFGLNPFGIDISDIAISLGKQWFETIDKHELIDRLVVGSVMNLPYKDESFNICVSHGVLDSMSRDIALKGIKEVIRVMKRRGLVYLDFIVDMEGNRRDEIVGSGYEKNTIQSYFTLDEIKDFLGESVQIIEFKVITWSDDEGNEYNRRAHLIIRKK